jgi:hypothetical protein
MKHVGITLLFFVTILFVISNSTSAQEQTINPVVFILDEGSQKEYRLFDSILWDDAAAQSDGALRATFLASEPDAIDRAIAAALEDGPVPNLVMLSTVNTPDRNSKDFRASVAEFETVLGYDEDPTQWPRKIDLPLCKLHEQRPNEGDTAPAAILLVLNDPNARLICYRLVMAYFAGVPGPDGERVAPLYVDGRAVTAQAIMPPISISSAYLALKDSRDADGLYAERPSNVYAPNEEIFLRAFLENVGRTQAGTMDGTYQIDLNLEVRDAAGEVLSTAELFSYTGKSTLIYPMDQTYFYNDITAGIGLNDPGTYVIAFLFTDASRPEMAPAEAAFTVVIE